MKSVTMALNILTYLLQSAHVAAFVWGDDGVRVGEKISQ